MGLKDERVEPERAPAAGESIAGFHEVNGALVLGTPLPLDDAGSGLIHLDKRAGLEDGIHGVVFIANEGVGVILGSEMAQHGKRECSPLLHHSAQVRSGI